MSYATRSHLYLLSWLRGDVFRKKKFHVPNVSWCRVMCNTMCYIVGDILSIGESDPINIPLDQLPHKLKDLCLYSRKHRGDVVTMWMIALTWNGEAVDMKITSTVQESTQLTIERCTSYPCVSVACGGGSNALLLQPDGMVQVVSHGKEIDCPFNFSLELRVDWNNGGLSYRCIPESQLVLSVWSGSSTVYRNSSRINDRVTYATMDREVKYAQLLSDYKLTLLDGGRVVEECFSHVPPRYVDECCGVATIRSPGSTLFWLCIRQDGYGVIVGMYGNQEFNYVQRSFKLPKEEILVTNTGYIRPRVQIKSSRKR